MAGRYKGKPSGKPRVLAVDDEILNLRLASLMLMKSGFEVDQATDGYKALELLEANHGQYCLVTLDEVMPKLRGSEMLALWRKHEEKLKLPRVLVVMVTANGQLDDRVRYDRNQPRSRAPRPDNLSSGWCERMEDATLTSLWVWGCRSYSECGADGLLIKPLNISKVGRELVDLLHHTWETPPRARLDPERTFGSLCNLHTTLGKDEWLHVLPLGASTSEAPSPEPTVPTSSGRSDHDNHDTQAVPPTAG